MPIDVDVKFDGVPEINSIKRTIERFGIMNLSTDDRRIMRGTLQGFLLREPTNRSRNFRFEPPREFLGYVMLMNNNDVAGYFPIEFPRQIIYQYKNESVSWHLQDTCTQATILSTQSIDAEPITLRYTAPFMPDITQFRFRLHSDAVMLFEWTYESFYLPCADAANIPNNASPISNEIGVPEQPSPPGTLFPISPPYSGVDDGGLTYNPGNQPPPGPQPSEGSFKISYVFAFTNNEGQREVRSVAFEDQGCGVYFYPITAQPYVGPGTVAGTALYIKAQDFNQNGQVEFNISGDFVAIQGTLELISFLTQPCEV